MPRRREKKPAEKRNKADRPYRWDTHRVVFIDGEGKDQCARHGASRVGCRETKTCEVTGYRCKTHGRIQLGCRERLTCKVDHLYTYLAAVDEDGQLHGEIYNPLGLGTRECLDFILSLPEQVFAFSFKYDLTKILEEVADDDPYILYLVGHPDHPERERRGGKYVMPEYWSGGYYLDLMQGRFEVSRPKKGRRPKQKTVVWDIFKYFQSSFVAALDDWQIGEEAERRSIEDMKGKRGQFAQESDADVARYCQNECRLGARLVRQLIEAMRACGLRPKQFFSPGSLAKDFMTEWGVRDKLAKAPGRMRHAVARAYFGGRFELSMIGTV